MAKATVDLPQPDSHDQSHYLSTARFRVTRSAPRGTPPLGVWKVTARFSSCMMGASELWAWFMFTLRFRADSGLGVCHRREDLSRPPARPSPDLARARPMEQFPDGRHFHLPMSPQSGSGGFTPQPQKAESGGEQQGEAQSYGSLHRYDGKNV